MWLYIKNSYKARGERFAKGGTPEPLSTLGFKFILMNKAEELLFRIVTFVSCLFRFIDKRSWKDAV
jgi:hypothetical protein